MGFQIILTLFIFIVICRLFVQFKKRNINLFFFLFFVIIWGIVLFFNWNNTLLNKLGNLLGLAKGADVLVYVALIFLFYYVFVSVIRFYKLEKEISKLVRKDAVGDFLKRYNIKSDERIPRE